MKKKAEGKLTPNGRLVEDFNLIRSVFDSQFSSLYLYTLPHHGKFFEQFHRETFSRCGQILHGRCKTNYHKVPIMGTLLQELCNLPKNFCCCRSLDPVEYSCNLFFHFATYLVLIAKNLWKRESFWFPNSLLDNQNRLIFINRKIRANIVIFPNIRHYFEQSKQEADKIQYHNYLTMENPRVQKSYCFI